MSTDTKSEPEENTATSTIYNISPPTGNINVSEAPIISHEIHETEDAINVVTTENELNEPISTKQDTIVETNPREVEETTVPVSTSTEQDTIVETNPREVEETTVPVSTSTKQDTIVETNSREVKETTVPVSTPNVESESAVTNESGIKKSAEIDESLNEDETNVPEKNINDKSGKEQKVVENNTRISNTDDTTDANNQNENEKGPRKKPLKRSKSQSQIRNRTASCQKRRVFANIDLPKDLVDRKGRPKHKYVTNKIVTSKYTAWTFIPKNLFEQFRKAANLYFLFMAILGLLPFLIVNNPILTVLPLSIVVFFTALKDGIEDRNRHRIDKQFNSATCYILQNFVNVNYPKKEKVPFWKKLILRFQSLFESSPKTSPTSSPSSPRSGVPNEESMSSVNDDDDSEPSQPTNETSGSPTFRKVMWRNVRVGDFLYLRNNDPVPADAIILSTSEKEGTCFVETKDLDGETNLKPRRCVSDTKDINNDPDLCAKINFHIESEAPNSNLYSYNAAIILTEPDESNSRDRISTSTRNSAAQKWKEKKKIPVDINNLLLRAHVIRNTDWVIAITVFTGVETKIMLNSSETPSKRSRIDKEMNTEVILNFFVLIILALVCAIGSALSTRALMNRGVDVSNLDSSRESVALASFVTFWASLIIFQNIIPISLYISIEFVKLWQAYFIYHDLEMWDEDSESAAVPKSWNLSDDLGQIEYVFSDKTGTLTRNVMEFRQCSVAGKVYGRNGWGGKTDAEKGKEMIQGIENVDEQVPDQRKILEKYLNEMKDTFSPNDPIYLSKDPEFLTFVDPEIFKDLRNDRNDNVRTNDITGEESNTEEKLEYERKRPELLKEFFTLLAVCHTVVVDEISNEPEGSDKSQSETTSESTNSNSRREKNSSALSAISAIDIKKLKNSFKQALPSMKQSPLNPSPSSTTKSIPVDKTVAKNLIYKAESPDEAALVAAAKNLGFVFLSRSTNSLKVDILGKEHTFEILNILEFNSTRKRMSVIVRRPAELGGGIVLFCKGADNVIMERLSKGQDEYIKVTYDDIEDFSNDGLRTLTLAYRNLNDAEYESWANKYQEAASSVENRSEEIDAISETIEKELILLGATAIEDKLQEGVPDSIASLREADIKVWVLTGDKLETAINIGFAAQLLTKEMRLWVVRGSEKQSVMKQFSDTTESFIGDQSLTRFTEDGDEIQPMKEGEEHAFIVDGAALAHLLEDEKCRRQIIELSDFFHSVICCRVSPLQKAMVVELIRNGKKSATLAIGDGANDVSMIQAANVGVGISGQEGVQASMAADYSIAQFRFLKVLLLVHGHWDYMRISEMILNFFYKNVIWVFPVLWYQIFCLFSANIFYDYSFVQLYNMIFTVAPVIILGATDQSVGREYCLRYPMIYSLGIRGARYSRKLFGLYFFDGIWQSLVVYFTFDYIYYLSTNITTNDGSSAGAIEFSTAVAVTVVVMTNLFVGLNTYHWTWFMWVFVIGEIISIFAFILAYGVFQQSPIFGIGKQLIGEGIFWFGMAFAILVAGLPRFVVLFIKQWWYPDELDIVRQIRKAEKREKREKETSSFSWIKSFFNNSNEGKPNHNEKKTKDKSHKIQGSDLNPPVINIVPADNDNVNVNV